MALFRMDYGSVFYIQIKKVAEKSLNFKFYLKFYLKFSIDYGSCAL